MPQTAQSRRSSVEVKAQPRPVAAQVLTPEALAFVEQLVLQFNHRRLELLARREARQRDFRAGELPRFLPETEGVRRGTWTVAAIPADLRDRRVEITGPVDRKMVINALNSGANVYMADFEDANAPTWDNVVEGQLNLRDAVRRRIAFVSAEGKRYALNSHVATLCVRPRGWHLDEKHLLVDGAPAPAALVDFGLFLYHNGRELLDRGSGPYFYLPKLESHLEARLWNDIFVMAQDALGLPRGSIRATVLIETVPAAFEMDEILYELREHSGGLNCGRWDYIFSFIKKFQGQEAFTLPDRGQVTMSAPNMRAYSLLAIQTCHKRGIHAMGGMAAQIPIKSDPAANEAALEQVREDKVREAADGHDGTWVAHPGLVALARQCFDEKMPGPNQIERRREDVTITEEDLLAVPRGEISEKGIRHNIDVALQYMAAWLGGNGCVPIHNLMEDAATAEISRAQLWQWVHHASAVTDDGHPITVERMRQLFAEERARLRASIGERDFDDGTFPLACSIIEEIVFNGSFTDFMTSVGYRYLD